MSSAEETIQERRRRLSSIPRACEGCKIRKVRCDRTIPCANCQASKIACRHPGDKLRSRDQADKVVNLEGIVERLEARLRSVESRLASLEPSQRIHETGDAANLDVPSSGPPRVEEGHIFEGNLSFTNQSLQASESAQMAVLPTVTSGDSAIDHSFHQLQETLRDSYSLPKYNFFFSKSVSPCPLTPEPLPVALVTCILRSMRVRRPIFLSSYAINDVSLVERLCQRVYSTSELASAGDIASMHGVLFAVLKEFIAMKDQLCQKFDLATYLDRCERNFINAIETYEVLAVPSFENILALTMGMLKSQGEAKPYLYWNLLSAAVTHCQSLGYHRESSYRGIPSGKAENIRRLFWTVYTFDKNMSLVLGRVSYMHGFGIDTRYPTVSADPAFRAWDESFIMGIRLAELQGRIFDGLYSNTMAKVSSEQAQFISELGVEMENWHFKLKQMGCNNLAFIYF